MVGNKLKTEKAFEGGPEPCKSESWRARRCSTGREDKTSSEVVCVLQTFLACAFKIKYSGQAYFHILVHLMAFFFKFCILSDCNKRLLICMSV